MTAQDYIIRELNKLVDTFQNITFKYKLDQSDNTHIILVEPLIEFEQNKEYLVYESELEYFFEKNFIHDEIIFISTNSLVKIGEPDLVFQSNKRGLSNAEPQYFATFNFELIGIPDNISYIFAGESSYALAA